MSTEDRKVSIKMEITKVKTDPPINVITITTEAPPSRLWPETFGSVEKTEGFLLGLRVMAAMLGRQDIDIPSIPREMRTSF